PERRECVGRLVGRDPRQLPGELVLLPAAGGQPEQHGGREGQGGPKRESLSHETRFLGPGHGGSRWWDCSVVRQGCAPGSRRGRPHPLVQSFSTRGRRGSTNNQQSAPKK